MFDDDDDLGRSYKTDKVYEKFKNVRIFCICASYSTSLAILLISLQIASTPTKKLVKALANKKHASILYSLSLVWLIDIIWIIYLDYMVLLKHSTLYIPEDVYSGKFIYFIVIADFILIMLVLIITPLLCKETFFQRSCKLDNNYVTASKEFLVVSTFMIFAVIHANHLIFILFGFLVEPIHAIAKLIEFVTTIAYFITIFNTIFQYHSNHGDSRKSRFLYYTKLALKLMYFYLYFLVLFFTFSYLLHRDLMITEYQSFIKSISISALIWLVIISVHLSHRWSGVVNHSTTTATNTTTNVIKSTSRGHKNEQGRAGDHELREPTRSPTVGFIEQRTDQELLIDDTSTESSEV